MKKCKFGGLAVSKQLSNLPFSGMHFMERWGLNYIYYEKDKIMSDPDTSIYFGRVTDNTGNKIDDIVVKVVSENSREVEQLMNENNKLNIIETTSVAKYIPRKYDFIVPEYSHDNTYKLIMQRVGKSLESISAKQKISAKTCLSIMYQAIEALQALHEAGVGFAHNDIKPGNMCIGLKDPNNLKLIDLGISEQYSKLRENYPRVQNRINGSPYYVSPEIWYGKDFMPVSRKHDLQSLLYVILELYHGSLPWKNITMQGVNWSQVPAARKQIADYKDTAVVSEIDKIRDPEFVNVLIQYYTIVWNTGLFKKPGYKKLMNRIKRYPGFTRDIVISPRT